MNNSFFNASILRSKLERWSRIKCLIIVLLHSQPIFKGKSILVPIKIPFLIEDCGGRKLKVKLKEEADEIGDGRWLVPVGQNFLVVKRRHLGIA